MSLSTLNQLGRQLYRSFVTVLGEAVANSWDAGAKNVWIEVDRDQRVMVVRDDGEGMNANEFQNRFLRVGYSKRRDPTVQKSHFRPFIGRKGVGKLALMSCSKRVVIFSGKEQTGEHYDVAAAIDNDSLDRAIKSEAGLDDYPLESVEEFRYARYIRGPRCGTIIIFEGLKDGMINQPEQLMKIVALYFKFSLIDPDFNIYVDGRSVDIKAISDLIQDTEFLWVINDANDPMVEEIKRSIKDDQSILTINGIDPRITGFIASVRKPADLKIRGMENTQVSIDLFANGSLREHNIKQHLVMAKVVENYLYGQIYFDSMDDDDTKDRFTAGRERVMGDDSEFGALIEALRNVAMRQIIKDWDRLRRERREDGDPDEIDDISPAQRKAEELTNRIFEDFISGLQKHPASLVKIRRLEKMINQESRVNLEGYARLFILENLLRRIIISGGHPINDPIRKRALDSRKGEKKLRAESDLQIPIRINEGEDTLYLEMGHLLVIVDPGREGNHIDRVEEKKLRAIRNAVMHTAPITQESFRQLQVSYESIKHKIHNLIKDAS